MKTSPGRFFEDFALGETIRHATPRTVTTGDAALYTALYGSRFAVQSSDAFARALGYPRSPLDDWLVFHVVFGKTVPDISINAVANLGYADGRFLRPVYPGTTLASVSVVIGLKESSERPHGHRLCPLDRADETGEAVLTYCRWVLVNKRDGRPNPDDGAVPDLPKAVDPARLGSACPAIDARAYDAELAGSPDRWGDYAIGETIDHVDGLTVEEAEHQLATRLYQNTAKVHFDQHAAQRAFPAPVDLWRARDLARPGLSFNGFGQCVSHRRINGGRHVAPLFAATRSMPGAKCWTGPKSRAAMMSAPCGSAWWQRRTSPAPPFRTRRGRGTTPPLSWIWITGRCCPGEGWALAPQTLPRAVNLDPGYPAPLRAEGAPPRQVLDSRRADGARLPRSRTQIVSSRSAQESFSSTRVIAMVRAARRAVVSGTMPRPTPASTMRHTASKLRS